MKAQVLLMDSGYSSISDVAAKLKIIPHVSIRMVLLNKEGQWLLHTLLVDILPNELQGSTSSYHYNYDVVVFIARTVPGADMSEWLLNKGGEIDSYRFQYVLQQNVTDTNVNWTRLQSNATTRFAAIAYPCTLYTLPAPSNAWGLPSQILVNDHCPFFPNGPTALTQLIYEIIDPYQGTDTHEAISIRFIHTEARIKHIEISPTMLSFEVVGTNLRNTQLQISGPPELQVYEPIEQTKRVDYPLPNGMPPTVWIVLSRATEWLDYAYLNQRSSPFAEKQDNVTFSPPDIRTQIQELIAQGEGLTIEFKRHISDDGGTAIKTVAAFANGEGGVILLGIDDKSGAIVGITESVNRTKDSVTDLVRRKVVPEPDIHFESYDFDGKQVVAVYIDKGTSRPYGINPEKPEFFVRRGATTFPAKQEEIVALAQNSI